MTKRSHQAAVGDVFVNVSPPRREWRVVECDGDSVTIERVDRSGTRRYVELRDLLDSTRYVRG